MKLVLSSNFWSEDDCRYLAEHFRSSSHSEMGRALGRTPHAVRSKCSLLGLVEPKLWTADEVAKVTDWYGCRIEGVPLELGNLAGDLGRPKSSVSKKAGELGLTNRQRKTVERINGRRPSEVPRFATAEALGAHVSARMRAWIAEHGHPRGALGMKHSPESKVKMSESLRKWRAELTPEEVSANARKAAMTRLERYGNAGPKYAIEENAYSRARGGRREDLENRYFRSAWEANYARYLNWLVKQGEIQKWEYEADTFVFHGETRGVITYRPDFKVTERNGAIIYHEVKGWMDGPSKTRLKRMEKHYPDVKLIVIGEPEYKAIAKWKGLIPEWE